MLIRTKRRFLISSSILMLLLLIFIYKKHKTSHSIFSDPAIPIDEDCLIPPLVLWPENSRLFSNQTREELNCSSNGLRFTIEKPRKFVDFDSVLPKAAWLENGSLRISPESGPFKCDAFPIFRLDEYRSVYGQPMVDVKSGDILPHPQVMLLCQPRSNSSAWDTDLMLTQRRFYLCGSNAVEDPPLETNSAAVNVLLLGVDSLSRLAWYRYMPRTVEKLTSLAQSRGAIFQKYHIVGDGTTSNLLALLTGHFEEGLPESRRFALRLLGGSGGLIETPISGDKEHKGNNATPLDTFPWIWGEFKKKAGYATHFIEDAPNWGTFQYRLQGFGNLNPPVDSYGRPCMVAAAQDESRYGKELGCTASTPTHKLLLASLREFFRVNSHVPRFSLTFLSEMIHEDPTKARLVDADVAELLDQVDVEDEAGWGAFANTLVVLFSDHGPRMGAARLSLQGKLEERLPMLAILLPRKFVHDWPEVVPVLQSNTDRVCSPFDLHATLSHLLTRSANRSARGRSLFTPLPRTRTCQDAGVARHWCTCAHCISLRPSLAGIWPSVVRRAVETTLDKINAATRVLFAPDGVRLVDACERLDLDEIISAEIPRLSHDLVRFRGTADRDGRVPLFGATDEDSAASPLRLHFRVKPKEAHFEVLLHRDTDGGAFRPPALENIRRLDAFEEHAKCLDPQKWSQARKLCICR